ncbi:MAG: helix-turn-helix domain-containing protein, partial [Gemmatimonadota bacterium]|nr:helix-turn-helix domain-containing protein [Gemmatimonadota bacterium]
MPLTPITPWHVSFGLRLRRAREEARYSTRQVAALVEERFQLKLSHGSLARIERGEQRISVGMVGVLCAQRTPT